MVGDRSTACHLVPELLEVAREASLTTSEVERSPPRRRDELEELIAMELPVAVVAWRPSPRDPALGVRVPDGAKVGVLQAGPLERAVGRNRHTPKLACSDLRFGASALTVSF